jgi:Flp pilus assembly pilin Flp
MKREKMMRIRKVLNRLVGDKAGGVMMEYVILAVLIAAAVVVAVAMFGKTLVGMFGVISTSSTARETTARSELDSVRSTTDQDKQKAADYHDNMHEPQ